jgi:hypothetical protein
MSKAKLYTGLQAKYEKNQKINEIKMKPTKKCLEPQKVQRTKA